MIGYRLWVRGWFSERDCNAGNPPIITEITFVNEDPETAKERAETRAKNHRYWAKLNHMPEPEIRIDEVTVDESH